MELSYISGNTNPEETSYIFSKESYSYISRNRTFLYFSYISGRNFPSPKNEKNYF